MSESEETQLSPWEQPDRPVLMRYAQAVRDAFRPLRSAPQFANTSGGPSWALAAATFLPLAVLEGVVPFTRSIQFGPAFSVILLNGATQSEVVVDVMRASALGTLLSVVRFISLLLPYVSLAKAYGRGRPQAPLHLMLYRAWLLPAGQLLLAAVAWGLPASSHEGAVFLVQLVVMVPVLMLLVSMRVTARAVCGVGPWASLVVVLVPFAFLTVVEMVLMPVLRPWLPANG